MGRTLPTIEPCMFLLFVVVVARRYELKMDPHTKQCESKTRSRFHSGLSLTGREVRTMFPMVVQRGKCPPPPSITCVLAFVILYPCFWDQAHATMCMVHTG